MIDPKADNAYGPFGSTSRTDGPKRFQEDSAMPRRSATQHELARIELLAGLPGELVGILAKRMEREDVAPGTVVVRVLPLTRGSDPEQRSVLSRAQNTISASELIR